MRLVPRDWHTETWVCSMRGHVVPAAGVAVLRPEDRRLGIEVEPGKRLCRCVRCDMWKEVPPPAPGRATREHLPPVAELAHPRRGKALQEAVLLRVIAIERAVHSVIFTLLALALAVLELKLPGLKSSARSLNQRLSATADQTGQQAGRNRIGSVLHRVIGLHQRAVTVLLITAIVYAVIEGVEAVGLWRERRWAEYLTVVATFGFLPFEVHELIRRVTVLRVSALLVNLAILVWLVVAKHLFGVRGGEATLHEAVDWEAVLASSAPARHW